jgi:hypothetical protein
MIEMIRAHALAQERNPDFSDFNIQTKVILITILMLSHLALFFKDIIYE